MSAHELDAAGHQILGLADLFYWQALERTQELAEREDEAGQTLRWALHSPYRETHPNLHRRIITSPKRIGWATADTDRANEETFPNSGTLGDLRMAFAAVKDEINWKDPVDAQFAQLTIHEERLIEDACLWFGAGPTEIYTLASTGLFCVSAPGYYMTIGA